MKKILFVTAIVAGLMSCNGTSENGSTDQDTANVEVGPLPADVDTTRSPSGVDNSSVISTDTAAMNVENATRKRDSSLNKE